MDVSTPMASSSSSEDHEVSAQKVLDQCERLEKAQEKIDETVRIRAAAHHQHLGGDGPLSGFADADAGSAQYYRRQLDFYCRALLSAQENARLKQTRHRDEIATLKNELATLRSRDRTREVAWNAERDTLTRNRDESTKRLAAAERELENAEKETRRLRQDADEARKRATETEAENKRLKAVLLALRDRDRYGFCAPGGGNGSAKPSSTRPTLDRRSQLRKSTSEYFCMPGSRTANEKTPNSQGQGQGGGRLLMNQWSSMRKWGSMRSLGEQGTTGTDETSSLESIEEGQ